MSEVVKLKPKGEPAPGDLAVGSLIQLKSGGPLMTVQAVKRDKDGRTMVTARWFTEDEDMLTGMFELGELWWRELESPHAAG